MATTFRWDTCACVTTYSDDDLALQRYDRKCPFHQKMSDAEAFDEIKSAHLTKARVIKAGRRALYGDERNPVKYGFGPDVVVDFEETASNRRTVVLDEATIPANRRAATLAELAKIASDHPIEVKAPARAARG